MPIDRRFLDMMPLTIKVFKKTATNAYGNASWAAQPKTYRCRIMDADQLTRTDEGDEVVIAGKAIIFGVADVTTDDRIELPNGDSPVIVTVDQHTDDTGPHHTTIMFGR